MEYRAKALELHRKYPVVDGHADSILEMMDKGRKLIDQSEHGHLDFPRARQAELACTVQAAYVAPQYYPVAPRRAADLIDGLLGQVEAAGESVQLARTAREIREAHAHGQLAVLINIEGAEAIQGSLGLLRTFYRQGVRMMGLVWNHRNEVADGAGEEGSGGGLTRFGREVVKEMNRLGMLIDLAHITAPGFYQVLELSEAPVLFTHGNCRALFDHPRNLDDNQIQALAQQGGVFGISFVDSFMGKQTASLRRVADHIDHVVQLLGSSHNVAYGSDFDGCHPPAGLEDVTRLPDLTAELLRRGYTENDMARILGGNYLRVFEQVLGG